MLRGVPAAELRAYGYVPQSEMQPYWTMAQQYTFADRMFQSNRGPSFPAHQYIISGTSLASAGHRCSRRNPRAAGSASGRLRCAGRHDVPLIDPGTGDESQSAAPCFDHPTLFDLLDQSGVTWRYYMPGSGCGTGPTRSGTSATARLRNVSLAERERLRRHSERQSRAECRG